MTMTTTDRVLNLLRQARNSPDPNFLNTSLGKIHTPDHWIPQWALCSIKLVGSTEGKRRLRELRTAGCVITMKRIGHDTFYRLEEE